MADPVLGGPGAAAAAGVGGPGGPFGGPGGPFGGFGFPGLGGGFGLDANAGGLFGGGVPFGGLGGFAPYIPVTPLGALGGYKGDLLVPIIVVGVALFLLLIIVLAVKAALVWKMELLDSVTGNKVGRSVADVPLAHSPEQMNDLTSIVLSALESERCLEKIICQIGAYGRGTSWPTYFSMIESVVPADYKQSLSLLKSSAQGLTSCDTLQCGSNNKPHDNASQNSPVDNSQQQQQQQQPQQNGTQTNPSNHL